MREKSAGSARDAGASIPVPPSSEKALRLGLLGLLLLLLAGRVLGGPRAWGFNHLHYLPGWITPVWSLLALLLAAPRLQQALTRAVAGRVPDLLFHRRFMPWLLILLAGGCFALLRERSFFMGDGYLVGELVDRGVRFRAFDGLDYLLHLHVYHALKRSLTGLSSFTVYRVASIIVGMLAVGIQWLLIRRLSWEPWRRASAFFLLFLMGPAALYFGYVESYTILFCCITAFLASGLLVLENRAPLWLASAFYGLALSFHLTALATGPALLFLALRAPVRPASRRWLEAAVPPAALFGLAVAIHFAAGFNGFWFKKEFLDAQNTHNLWIPLASGRGLFSTYLWKDQLNLALITAPTALIVVLSRFRRLRERVREPRVLFLLAQMLPIALLSILLDRKLGGARDWDLLAAHAGGLALLASLLLPSVPLPEPAARKPARSDRNAERARAASNDRTGPHPVLGLVLGTALLVTAPWILLLNREEHSIARFISVAADFPEFPRAYAYEEVGKYYRKAEDLARAQTMYERCIQSYPGNPRFHILLGAIYFMRGNYESAGKEYHEALRLDPKNVMAIEMVGKVALQQQQYRDALSWFERLVEARPEAATSWEMLGWSAMKSDNPEETARGFRRAMQLDPKLEYWHELGAALLQLGRYAEAADAFRTAIAHGKNGPPTRLGLGYSLYNLAQVAKNGGAPAPPSALEQAEAEARSVLDENPGDPGATELLRNLQALRLAPTRSR